MVRSILSASLARPCWQRGPFRVEGPDEDPFTLGVQALRLLGDPVRAEGSQTLHRLHLAGSFPSESEWAFAEALGIPGLEVRRHGVGSASVWGALAAATHDPATPAREAVIAADLAEGTTGHLSGPETGHGAGAIAFLLGAEPGLLLLNHGIRNHPPGRGPPVRSTIAGWIEAAGFSRGGSGGEVILSTPRDGTRWPGAWEELAPGVTVTSVDGSPDGLGNAPTVRPAYLVWELARRLRTGRTGIVAEATASRSGYAAFRLEGSVRWSGEWGAAGPGILPHSARFSERNPDLGAVSQGAYLPHPRYVENLASRWRLVGERCPECRALTFPTRGRCRACGRSEGLSPEPLPRTGLEVEAVTTISSGAQPTEFDFLVEATGGYDVALVGLDSDARATFQVTDAYPGSLRVGARVQLVLRRLYPMESEWRYGLKAVPETVAGSPGPPGPASAPRLRPRGKSSSSAPRAHPSSPRTPSGRAGSRRRRAR